MTEIELFMLGFTTTFAWGLVAWAAGFVRSILTGGHNE